MSASIEGIIVVAAQDTREVSAAATGRLCDRVSAQRRAEDTRAARLLRAFRACRVLDSRFLRG
jgi:hypothetical protein